MSEVFFFYPTPKILLTPIFLHETSPTIYWYTPLWERERERPLILPSLHGTADEIFCHLTIIPSSYIGGPHPYENVKPTNTHHLGVGTDLLEGSCLSLSTRDPWMWEWELFNTPYAQHNTWQVQPHCLSSIFLHGNFSMMTGSTIPPIILNFQPGTHLHWIH